jgi:sugar phosphate isomerase/epimerase
MVRRDAPYCSASSSGEFKAFASFDQFWKDTQMKFAICQELYEGWEWERQCEFSASLGYTGLELAPFTLGDRISDVSAEQRATLKKQAEDHGMEIIGLHWLLAKTNGLHLTTSDNATRKATTSYLAELGQACADFGGSVMVFGSPFQRNLEDGMSTEQAMTNAAEVFKACLPTFADRGVSICMEPLTPKETDFINTCQQAMDLIAMIDEPNIVLHQDVKAMLGAEEKSLPELIHEFKDSVGHFHVNDTNLLGPGMGDTDYRPIVKALLDSKYDGWVSVEVFDYSPGAENIAKQSIDYMKRIIDEVRA